MDPISGGLAVAGALAKGVGGLMAGNANSKALKRQANAEIGVGVAEEARIRDAARAAMGEQSAAQWSNGMTGDSGSALDALAESRINAAMDRLEIRRRAQIRAAELRAQGKQAKREGQFALLEGVIGAGSAAYQMKSDWADARRGQTSQPTRKRAEVVVGDGGAVLPGTKGPVF